ncbi:hypothetical protein ACFVVM_12740 [Nocardia sp. NPDC058176]
MTDHTGMNSLPVTPAIAPSNPIDALLLQLSHLVCQLLSGGNCAIIM